MKALRSFLSLVLLTGLFFTHPPAVYAKGAEREKEELRAIQFYETAVEVPGGYLMLLPDEAENGWRLWRGDIKSKTVTPVEGEDGFVQRIFSGEVSAFMAGGEYYVFTSSVLTAMQLDGTNRREVYRGSMNQNGRSEYFGAPYYTDGVYLYAVRITEWEEQENGQRRNPQSDLISIDLITGKVQELYPLPYVPFTTHRNVIDGGIVLCAETDGGDRLEFFVYDVEDNTLQSHAVLPTKGQYGRLPGVQHNTPDIVVHSVGSTGLQYYDTAQSRWRSLPGVPRAETVDLIFADGDRMLLAVYREETGWGYTVVQPDKTNTPWDLASEEQGSYLDWYGMYPRASVRPMGTCHGYYIMAPEKGTLGTMLLISEQDFWQGVDAFIEITPAGQ